MHVDPRLGTWRVPPGDRRRDHGNVVAVPGVERFAYDGSTVTMFLFTEKEWMWKRPDDIYRLEARWVGDELQYHPPFGRWSRLATWAVDHFEVVDDPERWVFEHVRGDMKDADDRKLDEPRPIHDYSIKPMDRFTP